MERPIHLGYHYISDGKLPGPTCTPGRLTDQITGLLDRGYKMFTCGQVSELLIAGKKLPDRVATLSFDDGLKTQFTDALPILKNIGVPATFFHIADALEAKLPPVIGFQILIDKLGANALEGEILPSVFRGTPYADLLDPDRFDISGRKMGESPENRRIKYAFNHFPSPGFKRDVIDHIFTVYLGEESQKQLIGQWFMTADELIALQNEGMEIGSHTISHPPLETCGKKEVEEEVGTSKKKLEDILGIPIITFAYPFGGNMSDDIKRIVLQFYTSGWNYTNKPEQIPSNPYADRSNIFRLNEQAYEGEVSI